MQVSDQTSVLEARNVWKVFGHKQGTTWPTISDTTEADLVARGCVVGLREASFSLRRGEIFMIMGLSGCGKSTLLRCLTGLYPMTSGSVTVSGLDLSTASTKDLIDLRRHRISMVFQNFAILPHLNVVENVAFPLLVQGMGRQQRYADAADAIELVGLRGKEHRYPAQLSGGQQQRVGIARSLVTDPEVWFLDEPFSALDPLIRKEMQNEFRRLQSQLHKSIVFVTHDLEEAMGLGDRIAIMSEGRILQIGTPEEIVLNPVNDHVKRFVLGIPKGRVIRAKSIVVESDAVDLDDEPVSGDALLVDIAQRVIMSERPVPVADADGRVTGAISRMELAPWLT